MEGLTLSCIRKTLFSMLIRSMRLVKRASKSTCSTKKGPSSILLPRHRLFGKNKKKGTRTIFRNTPPQRPLKFQPLHNVISTAPPQIPGSNTSLANLAYGARKACPCDIPTSEKFTSHSSQKKHTSAHKMVSCSLLGWVAWEEIHTT